MSGGSQGVPGPVKAPFHLWVVGLLLVLWNGWGIAIAIAAQTASFPAPDPQVAAYFAEQPSWFVLLADIGPVAGVAGSVALLLQSRWAPLLFVVQLGVLTLSNVYEVAIGTSLLLASAESRIGAAVLAVMIGGEILYARAMASRGVLY
jgi:hypothetical protein